MTERNGEAYLRLVTRCRRVPHVHAFSSQCRVAERGWAVPAEACWFRPCIARRQTGIHLAEPPEWPPLNTIGEDS